MRYRLFFPVRTFAKILFFGAVFVFGLSFVVMLLWNNVLAAVVNVGQLSYWQAMGILVLSKILFGGFRGGPRGPRGAQFAGGKGWWAMREKWASMTPEEREKFRSRMRSHCGDSRWTAPEQRQEAAPEQ